MNVVNFKFNNGDILRDKVTGLTGVVMVCAEYATGCHHYGLQSRELANGKPGEWEWLDQSRLELVKSSAISFSVDTTRRSGPEPKGPSM